jgi:hypothetical protein
MMRKKVAVKIEDPGRLNEDLLGEKSLITLVRY